MPDLLLGLDIGTTAVKAAVYDQRLQSIAFANVAYGQGVVSPHEGWAQHDVQDLWQGMVQAVRACVAQSSGRGEVVALSVSTQGGTIIVLDGRGQPLYPAISWMDTRAAALPADSLLNPDAVYRTTGWWSSTSLPFQHLRWLRLHEPAILRATQRVVFVADFVLGRMTGEYVADPSNAAITMLYNLGRQDWDDALLAGAGIARRQLSPLQPSGTVVGRLRSDVAAELGLPPGVLAVNGAHDQYCTALGAGVVQPGDALIGSGTAWVLLFATARPLFDDRQVFHPAPHAVAGAWGALSSIPSAGASVEWYLRQMAAHVDPESKYVWLNHGAAQSPAGSHGLLFMPHLGGFYSAAGDRPVRGAWIGLTLAHSTNDMSRSLLEGVAYEVKRLVELARAAGVPLNGVKMLGGATASPLWPQMVADVLNMPLSVPAIGAAACRGAAILAGVASGAFSDALQAPAPSGETLLQPDARNSARYGDLYDIYRDAFARLGDTFAALARAS